STGYGSVRAVVAGERYSYSYHNLGSWKYLKYRGWNSSTWYYWPNGEDLYYPPPPNNGNLARDPYYWFNTANFDSPYYWLKLSYQGG
ncbi:MAG: hypothetical protein Q8K89_05515, partial [Actinomycetota bacterium]|nr:hypothetical protein [Actinomycetota bacterium]